MLKNKGFQIFLRVFKMIWGDVELEIDPNIASVLKNAPITSIDVERSFFFILTKYIVL